MEETSMSSGKARASTGALQLGDALARRPANFVPLSPVSFLARASDFFADRIAVVHSNRQFTYRQFYGRSRRLAAALAKAGIGHGDTVAILAANVPAMLEAH